MRLVQIGRAGERRVGLVDGDQLRLLEPRWTDVYSLAMKAADEGRELTSAVQNAVGSQCVEYGPVYEGSSAWRLLPAFDHPGDVARCMVSGTGLTHKASAENRAAMHETQSAGITDSSRMYQMGLAGGRPEPGEIGVQPEWFFKGNGSILRAHGEALAIPSFGEDGGEEPEIAGVYVITSNGQPVRVGLTVGNEFSDHRMEKKNYLYLAPSKLRNCSIGPELTVGTAPFEDVPGRVTILRNGSPLWGHEIWTGQKNMSHTVANLEHHHFKYDSHRRPGDVHIHFFGADAFSFGEGVELKEGDVMEVSFPQFGRPLRNPLAISDEPDEAITVRVL
ncbi:MAG TPA: AraD1 family protein [Bryobacteraceae bacterium]|nr:AraD1 family protein [Bryobacteraceae bacterium]